MEEKIYLGDWLYNSGIVGFKRILDYCNCKDKIKVEDNFISFDTSILEKFHTYYFSYAYTKENTFSGKFERFKQLIKSNAEEKVIKEHVKKMAALKNIKEDKNLYPMLENESWTLDKSEIFIKAFLNHWEKYKELYVKQYLWTFYKGKSIFNANVTSNLQDKFKKDFIDLIFDTKVKKQANYCKVCNERIAKKDTFFDEGAFKLSGASANEYKNFYWNFVPNTHMCAICELIFLCSFAGLSNLKSIHEYNKYLFVNLDTTVDDLHKINNFLNNFITNSEENPFKATIHNILLNYEAKRSKWTLGNILFVEFDTKNEPYKIQHFHIPKYIAKLFTGANYKEFHNLEGFYYKDNKDNKENINVLTRTIDYILEGKSLYSLLNKTIRDLFSQKHYRVNGLFSLAKLQQLLKIYKIGGDGMENVTKKLWVLYHKGKEVADDLKKDGKENKINSIAYKMLSSLRVKDIKSFYDTMIRLHMNLEKEVPSIFLDSFSPDSPLDSEAIGYAFLTGLLGKEYSETEIKKEDKNE